MQRRQANFLLLLAAAIWGFGNISHKTVLDHLDPISVVGLTCLIGGLLTAPFIRAEEGGRLGAAWRSSQLRVTALFAAGVVVQQFAYVGASVTNASFLISTTTVMTPVAAWLIQRERPSAIVLVAALLTLAGSLLISGGMSGVIGTGDVVSLLAAALFALWTVELGRHMQCHGRPFATATTQFVATAIVVLPFSALNGDLHWPAIAAAWPELMVLGVLSMAVAFSLQTYAQRYTSASHAAVIVSAECVFAAAAAAAFLGERLSPDRIVGAGAVLAAVILVAASPTRLVHVKPLAAQWPNPASPIVRHPPNM